MPQLIVQATTEDQSVEESSSAHRTQSFLFVVMHCDNPLLGGACYGLSGVDIVEFGRGTERLGMREHTDRGSKLQIMLPGTTVSRSHGRLVRRDDCTWLLEDTGARNGCFVNGKRVTSAQLQDGDDLLIGDVLLHYRSGLRVPPGLPIDWDSEHDEATIPHFFTLIPEHQAKLADLKRIAQLPTSLILLGDSGVGKEVLAQSLHAVSGRSGSFVAVNCGALTPTLLESQLFGHVKGAFTGAVRDEPGYFRRADGGTLFLDEIGDLPLTAQSALLRTLQEKEVVPVGATQPIRIDVRVLAATHKRLDKMIARGEFRGDLWARLNGYRHNLPSLVDRIEDLGILTREILRRITATNSMEIRFGTQAARAMLHYPWPYNIRELAQTLGVAAGLANGNPITCANLSLEPRQLSALDSDSSTPPEDIRRRLITLLEKHHGNVSLVAKDLDKARTQVHRWLQRFAIRADDFRH